MSTSVVFLSVAVTLFANFPSAIKCVEYLENGVAKLSGGDIDVQTCVDNFDIHKDNIIRTQDSRAMGAKYLSEIELDSRLECLRLCCETEHCDVFVYEDKGPGSCYLFECGPPKDFKCKFTHHVNYTSGILGINRHSNADLEGEIQHEKDLNKLRNPNITPYNVAQQKESTNSPVLNPPSLEPTADTKKEKSNESILDKPSSKCSRNQFECRTSKDCIAIYNACDGVPQCPDGSDEAKELGCPDTSLGTTGVPLVAPQKGPPRMDIVLGSQSIGRLNSHTSDQNQHIIQDDYPNMGSLQPNNQGSMGREGVIQQDYNREQQLLQFPSSSGYQQQQQQQLYPPGQQQPLLVGAPRMPQSNWFPRPNNGPPALNPLPDKSSSHIFNHKVNGLQVADADPDALRNTQQQYVINDMNQREREYQQQSLSGGYYNDIYNNKQSAPQVNSNWQRKPANGLYNQQSNEDTYSQNSQQNWQPNEPSVVNPKYEQDQMAHELKHSKEHFEKTNTAQAPKAGHDHTKYAVVVDELAETIENIEDGVAQTPGGAVLSLILGLLITCMLAILIGCRLRVVRRRIRRGGGKAYAHDADYLVNGMYL